MQAITIGTAEKIEEIRQRLDDEFRFLQEEGVNICVSQSSRGRFTFLDCSVDEQPGAPNHADSLVRHYVANALSDVIVEKWEREMLRRIVRSTYHYFSRDEQEMIVDCADRALTGGETAAEGRQLYKVSRKNQILHRLRDYLDGADELVLEGFVTFRLRDYVEELEDAVDRAVDDFLMEREYREFVHLLKYFVDVQEPRIDLVHVTLDPKGSFRLLDESGGTIHSEYLEEFVVEMMESDVHYDDLLISALITLAPRAVRLHGHYHSGWEESVETIKGVFTDRVLLCDRCELCEKAVTHRGESFWVTTGH